MENLFYIVMYNDMCGDGTGKHFECIVKSKEDFERWLSIYNKERTQQGEIEEDTDDFDLIPINLFL